MLIGCSGSGLVDRLSPTDRTRLLSIANVLDRIVQLADEQDEEIPELWTTDLVRTFKSLPTPSQWESTTFVERFFCKSIFDRKALLS